MILRCDVDQLQKDKKVTLVTGGGSGHEPFSAGIFFLIFKHVKN